MAETRQAKQASPGFRWRDDFRMNTMDIVVAVLLGIIEAAIEILGALGFLERTVWATGAVGFVIYAVYNGTTWILFFAGAYLRKRASVLLLAIVVTHVVRWFMGDPDGPLLLWYALFPGILTALAFLAMRWRGRNLLFGVTGAVAAGTNQVALFVVVGFGLAGGASWGLLSILVGAIGGVIWGIVGRYLGIGLERAGVPSVDTPPARGGAVVHA
ncbi:MAG: hypothetical protein ACRDYU_05755 [Actinomycetes bacterium]